MTTVPAKAAAILILAGAAAGVLAEPALVADGILTYRGMATELATHQKLYSEEHYLRYQNGRIAERVVLYQCADGAPFARKRVQYVDRFAPDFETIDAGSGMHEGLRSNSGQREVFYRENSGEKETRKLLQPTAGLVADAGFDEFIRGNWDSLMSGQSRDLDFLVPSRLGVHGFQVKHVRAEAVDGVPAQLFRLRLSGILGLLLPGIEVYYSDAQRTLLRYDGLSNLQDADGKQHKVLILFPPQNRVRSDAAALLKAQQAPLRACGKG